MFDDLIGKPYESVGNCFELARCVCGRLGIEIPNWPDMCVSRAEAEIERRRDCFESVDEPQPGDMVHVRSMDMQHHVGVVIGGGLMIQATKKHGVHTVRLDGAWVVNRIMGFYRYVG